MVYSDSDFERLYLRYMAEAMPRGESIQAFCSRLKVPYNLFDNYEVIYEYRSAMTSEEKSRLLMLQQRMYDEAVRRAQSAEARSAELLAKVEELLEGQGSMQSEQGRMQSDLSSLVRRLA